MGWLKNVMVNIYVISLFRDSCPANGALPFKSDYIRCGVQTVLCKNPESILFFFFGYNSTAKTYNSELQNGCALPA